MGTHAGRQRVKNLTISVKVSQGNRTYFISRSVVKPGGMGVGGVGNSDQLRKRLQNKLKLTGYQSIHPTEKFAKLPGGDKLPQEPPPASSPEDRPMGMKPWKK